MKHIAGFPDVSDWGIDALDTLEQTVSTGLMKALSEVIHYAMQENDTYIYFPAAYMKNQHNQTKKTDGVRRGHEVADPLTLYLRVAATTQNGEQPTYSFNLRDALQKDLDSCKEDGSYSHGLGRLASALRGLADEIDAVIDSHR